MSDREEISNIISSLMSNKEDSSVSTEKVGDSIAVSISESLGKFFNRVRGPDQMSPVNISDSAIEKIPLVSYLDSAFLPVLESIRDAVQPLTKEEKEEDRRSFTNAISDAFQSLRTSIFGKDEEELTPEKKSGGFLSKILGGLGKIGEIGAGFLKGVIGIGALALSLVGFSFGLKKLMEVVGIDFAELLLATTVIGGFFLLIRQIGKDFSKVAKGVLAFGISVAALYGFAAALDVFTDINFVKVTLGGAALFGFFKVVSMMGAAFATVSRGALALGVIGASLYVFSAALKNFIGIDFEQVIYGGLAIAGFAAAAGLIGTFAVPILLGAAAIAALGVALIPAAFALDLFGGASEKFIPIVETLGRVLENLIGSVGNTFTKLLLNIENFSNNVNSSNLLAAAGGIAAIAGSLALFAGGDFLGSIVGAGAAVLDFFSGRVGNVELLGILASLAGEVQNIDALSSSIRQLSSTLRDFASIEFSGSIVNVLEDLVGVLNEEINLSAGLFERGLAVFGGNEISLFSGLIKLSETAEPMQMFAQATNLAADAITRLASALVAFDADTFDQFIRSTASEDFTELQENLNNSGLVASAVFATQLEEAVGAEVTRQIAAETGSAEAGGPVVIQNSAAPQVNNFSVNSSLQPTSTDLELMKIIGHGNILQ